MVPFLHSERRHVYVIMSGASPSITKGNSEPVRLYGGMALAVRGKYFVHSRGKDA